MRNRLRALYSLLFSKTWILITDTDASMFVDFDRLDTYLQLQSLESLSSNLEETIQALREQIKESNERN